MTPPARLPAWISSRTVRRTGLALLGLAAVSGAIAASARRPLYVPVAVIERAVPMQVYGLGTIEARVLSEIGFEVGGALSEVHSDHGDRVTRGQLLARLHKAAQEAKVAKARAGVVNADAALLAAQSALSRAKAILAQKETINRRKQALLGRQVTSVEAAGEAEKDEAVARADVVSADANIAVARAHVEDARSQQAVETVLLAQHDLVAPYDALVVKRHKEIGAVLKAGDSVLSIIDPSSVWGLAFIDESRAGNIRVGQPAEVRLRSRPQDVYHAKVSRVGIESDRVSEERRVYVACEQCPDAVHLGEQIEVIVSTGVLDEGLLVPEHAVRGFDGSHGTVWTVESDRLMQRRLRLGQRTLDGRIVVVERLPDGAKILTRIPAGAREGRAARIATASGEAGR